VQKRPHRIRRAQRPGGKVAFSSGVWRSLLCDPHSIERGRVLLEAIIERVAARAWALLEESMSGDGRSRGTLPESHGQRATPEIIPAPRWCLSTAPAMTEVACVEAKGRRRDIPALPDPIRRRRVCRAARNVGNFGRRLVDHHSVHHLFLRYRRHIGLRGGRGDAEQLLRPLG
jgi:hypothetical protein